MTELLRACIESGQVDAKQIEAHRAAGELATPKAKTAGPGLPMTEADLRHLADDSAPISDEERRQAAAEILRLQAELRRLREAIAKVCREQHDATRGIVTLHVIDGEAA